MKRVLVVQRRMTHYRERFFEDLRVALLKRGVSLSVAYGDANREELQKRDSGSLPWAELLPTSYLLGNRICWQTFGALLNDHDLVVVTHENKLLYNLYVQYCRPDKKVALWGHGANMQGRADSWRERFKRATARRADWWFAYTERSAGLVEEAGFPSDRITIVNNSVDMSSFASCVRGFRAVDIDRELGRLGLTGGHVGVFVGSLYREKRIEFLLNAAARIKHEVPSFELIIVGDGPERERVQQFCSSNPWAMYLGQLRGEAKAMVVAVGQLMLCPGGVGLGVLDSFVAGVPLLTTDCGLHGPEAAYLESGENALIARNDIASYVDAVVSVLRDRGLRQGLAEGCLRSAGKYSLDAMVENFSRGIEKCLESPRNVR